MLKFSKMQGLGNDFIIIDAINQQIDKLTAKEVMYLADRRYGIGCDQLLLVERPRATSADFYYRIFNADGIEVAQCGNGARCFARFVRDKALTHKDVITVETKSSEMTLSIENDGDVKVEMGQPQFQVDAIPFISDRQADSYEIVISDNQKITIGVLSIGNPHAVMVVADVSKADVARLGALLQSHARFPERVNVSFMEIVNSTHIRLRVYERGVGETLACGSAACAAVVSGIKQGLLAQKVTVDLLGGSLLVSWPDIASSVCMVGPATHVFDGEIAWTTIRKSSLLMK